MKKYNIKELFSNPEIKRHLLCHGTKTCMAREGIDVDIDMIFDMYDNYQSKGLRLPDGYYYEKSPAGR